MSSELIQSQLVLWDGYNLSSQLTRFALELATAAVPDTTLGDDTQSNAPGLQSGQLQVEGIYKTTAYDAALNSTFGSANKLISVLRNSTEGSRAWFMKAMHASYEPIKGQQGEIAGFSAMALPSKSRIHRGNLLFNQSGLSSSGSGTAQELGAVASTQQVVAGLHILAIDDNAGDTIDVVIESDAADDFSGSETTRITFDQMTDIGSQYKTLSGTITDTWWRTDYTIAGSTPSFLAVVTMAIETI